jgi:filamentous hemagglutinin family protein
MKKQSFLRDGERTRPRVQRRAPRGPHHSTLFLLIPLCILLAGASAYANPQGMTVVSGSAHTAQHGSTLQITTSQQAFLQWTSFNIAAGETTIFHEPSASSIVFNNIGGANPTTIFGSLRANGIVVLENANGFYFGPNAFVKAGGLVVTTAAINPWASGGGAGWSFDGPPAATPIVNYGHLETASGGSLFLIGKQIENHGTIEAPGGTAALLAGQEVLLSERPDGLSLSVPVRLPAGSVDNQGRIVADAGQVLLQAQTVNNSGVVQANSVRQKNGVIEFYASDDIQLTGSSVIQANGGADGTSPGGSITIKSGGSYSDAAGSIISVAGGPLGGNGGSVEISAPSLSAVNSTIDGHASAGSTGGKLLLDPYDIEIGTPATLSTTPAATTYQYNVNSAFVGLSQIDLQATHSITLDTFTTWDLAQSTGESGPGCQLTLEAGNMLPTVNAHGTVTDPGSQIVLNNGSSIVGGAGWSVTLEAGRDFSSSSPTAITSGRGNILLNGGSAIQTADGNINVVAGSSVTVGMGGIVTGVANGAVISGPGGDINVQAVAGSVNCGSSVQGYSFTRTGYTVSPNLGGISTANGGNVTIEAGGDIIATMPAGASGADAGSGAFGSAPGNVTLTAGGDVLGHYVLANGVGAISCNNAGTSSAQLALSLVNGGWTVNAADNIYLQEVRNPNGVFNHAGSISSPFHLLFDYSPFASVVLNAGNAVVINGSGAPRYSGAPEGLIFPPSLTIEAGAGGITLEQSISLFPSPEGGLVMTTTGGGNLNGNNENICVSDSQNVRWMGVSAFTPGDSGHTARHLNDPNPVFINISGSVSDFTLYSPKAVEMYVAGNLIDSSAEMVNLRPTDTSIISVGGEILDHSSYVIVNLPSGETPNFNALDQVSEPSITTPAGLSLPNPNLIPALNGAQSQFLYDPSTGSLKYSGIMPLSVEQALLSMTPSFLDAATIKSIYAQSQLEATVPLLGFTVAGPGTLRINAASMDLGNSEGVVSQGISGYPALAPYTARGADIDITLGGNLTMLASTIESSYGGNINIACGGKVDVGSLLVPPLSEEEILGIISLYSGNISVIADGDVNVDGSRIAAYDGGNIFVESLNGNVNAGTGGGRAVLVSKPYVNAQGQVLYLNEEIPGSGILATSYPELVPGETSSQIGNITVETPKGDIEASQGGIVQLALGTVANNDAAINLNAGSKSSDGSVAYVGNVDASGSGVVGGQVNITATGNVNGLVIASVGANVSALQNISATVLSQGSATVSAGGTVSGTVVGVGSVSVSGASDVAAAFSSSGNVSASGVQGGAALPTAPTGSSSTAAAATGQQLAESTQTANNEVASNSGDDDDPLNKRKKAQLMQYVGRVTVLLPQ